MGYPLTKLTIKNQHEFFGVKVKHGELFNYSQSFLYRDIEILARKNDYWILYCKPGTREYKMHGDMTCYAFSVVQAMDEMTLASTPKRKATAEDVARIVAVLAKFEVKKDEAAKVRDELREIASEVEEVSQSIEDGVDGVDDGIKCMKDALEFFQAALDDMSQYL